MRASRRRLGVAGIVVALVVVAWVPTLVANRYADGPGGAEVGLVRIDRGWQFVVKAVRESRGAALGASGQAEGVAREHWVSPARAESVRLVYLDGPFAVPVPPGGVTPPSGRRVAQPASPFGWAVRGAFPGRPSQLIGLLDYRSGRASWDILGRPAEATP